MLNNSMKKAPAKKKANELRPEYDLSKLKGGVRGKYYREPKADINLVLINPQAAQGVGSKEKPKSSSPPRQRFTPERKGT